jgi:hypothetical protein
MRYVILLLLILLQGCASHKVQAIAYQCPVITLPPYPQMPIANLTAKSQPNDVIKAYAASISICKGYVAVVTKQVNGS